MPLEFCFIPRSEETEVEVGNELVDVGQGLLIENFATGEREIMALECAGPEEGGKVRTLPPEGILAVNGVNDLEGAIDLSEFPAYMAMIDFPVGRVEDFEYDDGEGNKGVLRVRGVGSRAVTSSGLIPSSLIHPN